MVGRVLRRICGVIFVIIGFGFVLAEGRIGAPLILGSVLVVLGILIFFGPPYVNTYTD